MRVHAARAAPRQHLFVSLSAGYILALGPLVFVSVFDVWLSKFTTGQAYVVNLVSVGVVAFGCTGSYYGNLQARIILQSKIGPLQMIEILLLARMLYARLC